MNLTKFSISPENLSLSGKKKRKLTQTTLLQTNFLSSPKQSKQEDSVLIRTQKQPILDSEFNFVERSEPTDSRFCKVDDDDSYSPSSEEISKTVTLDEANDTIIETFIVGRKFSDVQDLEIGGKISLLRHPENIKDRNAIKV